MAYTKRIFTRRSGLRVLEVLSEGTSVLPIRASVGSLAFDDDTLATEWTSLAKHGVVYRRESSFRSGFSPFRAGGAFLFRFFGLAFG